jgi:putative MFS transporter
VTWLPVFFIKQGLTVATSFGYSLVMALGAPIGSAIGALTADRWGRKPTIIGASLISVVLGIIYPMISDPMLLPAVGFALTVPIYVLVALLFGIYIPELFPTEVRLRASGIVNTLGRDAVRGPWRRRRDGADDRAIGGADHNGLGARHRAAAP